jgi:RNA polymerase sigma factor (sigma-70 family)
MATNQTSKVIQHLRRAVLLQEGAGLTDGQLLGCFIEHRDEAAFAALVHRHGPMVWGVCRRLLNHHDAEDAFQATFLVLSRKTASIRPRELVANWLYGVAHHTALQARRTATRRRAREKQVTATPEPEVVQQDFWHDLQPLLDEELSRLADKYRGVIVLCDLEGKTRKEVAVQLGCPEGTVAGRLARARAMLAKRLARRGVVLSGGVALSQNVASAWVPTSVVTTTVKTAALVAAGETANSAKVVALTEGVLHAMLITKLKRSAVVLLMLGMVAFTCGMLAIGGASAKLDDMDKPAVQADHKPNGAEGDKDNTLTVTIKPKANRVRAKETFKVDLRVVNSSKATQSFQVMSCSWYEHWKSSNERVSWEGWDCAENIKYTVKLEPGEAYENTLPMLLAGEPQEKVSFKMGFTPIGSKQTFWSNEVTLQVEPNDSSKKEMAKLQGTWTAVSVERDGKSMSEEEVKKLDIRLTIKGNEFMLMPLASQAPEHFPYGTFQIDPTKKPKAINFTILPYYPGMKTSTVLGIYEVDGDSLKVLQGLPDQGRPTEFKTTPQSGLEFIVFNRAKP